MRWDTIPTNAVILTGALLISVATIVSSEIGLNLKPLRDFDWDGVGAIMAAIAAGVAVLISRRSESARRAELATRARCQAIYISEEAKRLDVWISRLRVMLWDVDFELAHHVDRRYLCDWAASPPIRLMTSAAEQGFVFGDAVPQKIVETIGAVDLLATSVDQFDKTMMRWDDLIAKYRAAIDNEAEIEKGETRKQEVALARTKMMRFRAAQVQRSVDSLLEAIMSAHAPERLVGWSPTTFGGEEQELLANGPFA